MPRKFNDIDLDEALSDPEIKELMRIVKFYPSEPENPGNPYKPFLFALTK